MKPDFPSSIRVGYRTYRIEVWHPAAASGARRYGEASHMERVLRIDLSLGPIQAAETLIHEIFHAISAASYNQDLFSGKDEERAVVGVSAGLTQVLRDNMGLRDWLYWAWAQEDCPDDL